MPRPSAADRARRLIALLGRLNREMSIPLDVLASELGVSSSELADDIETLSFCGLAPYDPYELVPVFVEDGMVNVHGDFPAVDAPLRLSRDEATALASAMQAAGYTAEDPLTRKLLEAASASFDPDEMARTLSSSIDNHTTSVYETLAEALSAHHVVTITHVRGEDGAELDRDIEPVRLFAERGCWYITAWCRRAEDWRNFKLERIRDAVAAGASFDPDAHPDAPEPKALPADGLPMAKLVFAPGETYVSREWPGSSVVETLPTGETVVETPCVNADWLARHVAARFGRVEVVGPEEVRTAILELERSL